MKYINSHKTNNKERQQFLLLKGRTMFTLNIHHSFFEDIDKNYILKYEGKRMLAHAVIRALHDFHDEQRSFFRTTLRAETMKFQFLSYFIDLASEYLGGDDYEQVRYYVDVDFDHVFYEGRLIKPVTTGSLPIKFDLVIHRRDTGQFEYPEKLVHFVINNTPRIADKSIRKDFASLQTTTEKSTVRNVIMQGYDMCDEGIYVNGFQLGIYLNFYHFKGLTRSENNVVKRFIRFFNDGEEITEAMYSSLFTTIIPEEE